VLDQTQQPTQRSLHCFSIFFTHSVFDQTQQLTQRSLHGFCVFFTDRLLVGIIQPCPQQQLEQFFCSLYVSRLLTAMPFRRIQPQQSTPATSSIRTGSL
jgi:hypothetical protein